MTNSPLPRLALALAFVLALSTAAFAEDDSLSFAWSKRGASGQVYAWQTGHC